jgi:hypothetical protein
MLSVVLFTKQGTYLKQAHNTQIDTDQQVLLVFRSEFQLIIFVSEITKHLQQRE